MDNRWTPKLGVSQETDRRQNGSAPQALAEDLVHFILGNRISLLTVTCGFILLLESTLMIQSAQMQPVGRVFYGREFYFLHFTSLQLFFMAYLLTYLY